MAVWHVFNKERSGLNLWRDSEGHFRVVMHGAFGPLLTGSDYVLTHNDLLPAFELLLSDQLETTPVKIYRVASGEQWDDYSEMLIKNHINPLDMNKIESFGEQIWRSNHGFFVSDELKDKLNNLSNGKLVFSDNVVLLG